MFWILLGGEGSERPGGWGGMGFLAGRLDWIGWGSDSFSFFSSSSLIASTESSVLKKKEEKKKPLIVTDFHQNPTDQPP